jgi:hypothetical protein
VGNGFLGTMSAGQVRYTRHYSDHLRFAETTTEAQMAGDIAVAGRGPHAADRDGADG